MPGQVVSTSPDPRLPAPKGAGALQARSRMVLFGASYPGRWEGSTAIRVGWPPAEPTRAVGEVRRGGVNRTALEGVPRRNSSWRGRPATV